MSYQPPYGGQPPYGAPSYPPTAQYPAQGQYPPQNPYQPQSEYPPPNQPSSIQRQQLAMELPPDLLHNNMVCHLSNTLHPSSIPQHRAMAHLLGPPLSSMGCRLSNTRRHRATLQPKDMVPPGTIRATDPP